MKVHLQSNVRVIRALPSEISHFREVFLSDNNTLFVHNKCHEYNWCDDYAFLCDGEKVGYASVWGSDRREERDTVFEFFVADSYRHLCNSLFDNLLAVSQATLLECQTNDVHTSPMFYAYAKNIRVEAILFEDRIETNFNFPDLVLKNSSIEELTYREVCFSLEKDNKEVASGGVMLNYNFPYADVYMSVNANHRRKGIGTYIVQELKKQAKLIGRIPAARCNVANRPSRATLLKSGFDVAGYLLMAEVNKAISPAEALP